jgi:hypothetical protein
VARPLVNRVSEKFQWIIFLNTSNLRHPRSFSSWFSGLFNDLEWKDRFELPISRLLSAYLFAVLSDVISEVTGALPLDYFHIKKQVNLSAKFDFASWGLRP